MKQGYFCILAVLLPFAVVAQPAGYYNSASGKSGEAMRQALYDIISKNTIQLNYGGSVQPNTWTAFQSTDKRPDGKVWDIYSDKPGSTPPYEYDFSQQCGNGSNHENSCFNHEHVWPQSKFNSSFPMKSDLWIVYPTDYYVNGQRADLPYGIVASATKTFMNGTKLGANATTGAPSGNAFEPIDSFKGDIARSYFYISTRYLGDSASFQDWEMALKSTLKPWAIQMLLAWHHADPVSAKERSRNEAAYAIQNNRNPFIDEPRFADCIWGGNCSGLSVASIAALGVRVSPNPASSNIIIDWQSLSPGEVLAVDVLNVQGQTIYHTAQLAQPFNITVSEWPKGFYLLQLKTQHGVVAKKLTIE